MSSAPRPRNIIASGNDRALPSEWQELGATTMMDGESHFKAATPGGEWESSWGERNESAIVVENIFGIMLTVTTIMMNVIVVMATDFKVRRASRLSSFYFLLGHLAIADLIIICVFLPVEMGWIPKESEGLERAWAAENNEACMIIGFFHFFGWYFLSFVLVTIILDRYWAFTLPLDAYPAVDRAKGMALVAGIASGLCSVPEAIFYRVEMNPADASAKTCMPDSSWRSVEFDLVYAVCKTLLLYGLPLITILTCSPQILRHMRIMKCDSQRGNTRAIRWAKIRSIQLCLAIALGFLVFWAPYHVWTLWTWIDMESFFLTNASALKMIQFFACANSCFNPIVHMYFRFSRTPARRRPERAMTEMTSL